MSSPATRPDQIYPSDLSRQQFDVIRPYLESARKKTSPHSDPIASRDAEIGRKR